MQHYFLTADQANTAAGVTAPGVGTGSEADGGSVVEDGVRRFSVSGDDIELARQTYEDVYGTTSFEVSSPTDGFLFQFASIGDERVTLRTTSTNGTLTGDVPHLQDYVVCRIRSGGGEIRRGGRTTAEATDHPFVLPSEQRFRFAFSPHRQDLIRFSPSFLEDVATEFHGGARRAVSFDYDARPSLETLHRWRTAVGGATSVLVDPNATSLMRINAQRPLARALLTLFPWFGLDIPPSVREPQMARTRLALEYFHHHAHEAVTPADAARVAGLHTRTLQVATQRHLGMSPSAYLRRIRLDRARRELIEATPETTTVATIARGWGFGNLGRFAASYQAAFAEKPYDTLRR